MKFLESFLAVFVLVGLGYCEGQFIMQGRWLAVGIFGLVFVTASYYYGYKLGAMR